MGMLDNNGIGTTPVYTKRPTIYAGAWECFGIMRSVEGRTVPAILCRNRNKPIEKAPYLEFIGDKILIRKPEHLQIIDGGTPTDKIKIMKIQEPTEIITDEEIDALIHS